MGNYHVISSDGHINEPHDLFETRLPHNLLDIAPKVVSIERGDAWVLYPGAAPRAIATSAAAGRSPEQFLFEKEPVTYKNMRPGSFDPAARIADMDLDEVDVEVLYPGIMRGLAALATRELRAACARAYNDWMAEFCSYDPRRLIGLPILPPLEEVDEAIEEMVRTKDMGFKGVFLSQRAGGVAVDDPRAETFWASAAQFGLPVSLHLGVAARGAPDSNPLSTTVPYGFRPRIPDVASDAAALISAGIFERYPNLKLVLVEAGIGWIPYFLQSMDFTYERHGAEFGVKLPRPPSDYFHRSVFVTFQHDLLGMRLLDLIGVENVMWASDYPHSETTWPHSQEIIEKHFSCVPERHRQMVLADNVVKLYGLV